LKIKHYLIPLRYYISMEMKVVRKVTKYNTAYYLNLPRIWIENHHIERKQPLVIIIKENGNLEIAKLGGAKHE